MARRQSAQTAKWASSFACSAALSSPAVAAAHNSRNSSCTAIHQMPQLPIGLQLVAHSLSPTQRIFRYIPAELFKTSVVVVSNVGVGLAKPLGDLRERQPLKEMQPQRLPLLFRQRFQHLPPALSTEKAFGGLIVVCSRNRWRFNPIRFVRNPGRPDARRLQLAATEKRLRIGDLKDPRAARSF